MCGSGAKTGTEVTVLPLKQIRQVQPRALAGYLGAAAGATPSPGAAVCRAGTATRPTAGATASGFVLPCSWLRLRLLATTKLEASFVLFVRLSGNVLKVNEID